MPKARMSDDAVVLFDGVCVLCQGAVKFIFKRDPHGCCKFAAMQSELGQQLLRQNGATGIDGVQMDTMFLLENGVLYNRSSAALRIVRRLRFPWPLLYVFIFVPRVVRDAMYRWIAKNRYRWFGKVEACMLPSKEIRGRFLDL